MLDFLRILNYKHELEPQQAKAALLHGDPRLIYPALSWMLQRLPELQKRAYLARFLVNVEVPEHMFADEEVVEVYQNYKDLQEEFKEVHKASEKYKSQLISPYEIKKAQLLQAEARLNGMVERLNQKRSERTSPLGAHQLLEALAREVVQLEKSALETFPQEIQQKQ